MKSTYFTGQHFFDSLGRYTPGSGKYERGIYASIFSAPDVYNRTTVKHEINLSKPRFNLCLLAHPTPICRTLIKDKKNYN